MTTVIHRKFGKGNITSQDSKNITVQFDKKELTFLKVFCGLKLEDGTDIKGEYTEYELKGDPNFVPKKRKKWYEVAEDIADKRGLFFDSKSGNMHKL